MARKYNHSPSNVSESDPLPTEHTPVLTGTASLIAEIKETADKLERDGATRGDLKLLARALKELRYAFKVFAPYRKQRKVTVFGSARMPPDHPAYIQSAEFGRRMAQQEWFIVTGAGGGIMEGAHVGAGAASSMGVNIMLPFEQEANYVIEGDKKLVHLKYFFTRKLIFVKEVHAIVCFPGGFGTQDEAFETLTLVQTGKRDLMPIVLIDPPGSKYWANWKQYVMDNLLADGLISPEDMALFRVTSDIEAAVDEILDFYCVYNSMRYVRGKLVIRLHAEPDEELMERLNVQFKSLLASGRIEKCQAHPLEADDEHLLELPRITFDFNRRDIGKLRLMIDTINHELGHTGDDGELLP
jgi:uncharacterized protein (TIGR00730 family)